MWRLAKQLVKQAEDILVPEAQEAVQGPEFGFRVLYVEADSAAARAGLEPWFDFIVFVNGRQLLPAHTELLEETVPREAFMGLLRSAGATVTLGIWSAKGGVLRQVNLPVSESIGAGGAVSFGFGAELQWTPTEAGTHVWHVLDVSPGSPAQAVGLVSHADYIIGASGGLLDEGGESLLGRLITQVASHGQELELYVYNHDYDVVRPVRARPNYEHGKGSLGCGVGYGLLHRLPTPPNKTQEPGSVLWEAPYPSVQAKVYDAGPYSPFAPAPSAHPPITGPPPVTGPLPVTGPPPVTSGPPPMGPAHKSKKVDTKGMDLDSYFAEQTALSYEIDGRKDTSR